MWRAGPFRLEAPIGEGASATVWRASDPAGGIVAVKLFRAGLDAERRAAVEREVRAVAGLDHPGIVAVLDAGRLSDREAAAEALSRGQAWIAFEYASLGSLAALPRPVPWTLTRRVLLAVLDALAHAHARALIHRDVKPENIVLCGPDSVRPGPKLADFGIAAPLHGGALRASGTATTIAPEQIAGALDRLGPATDLYSLGCTVWWLATGSFPFDHPDRTALLEAHLYTPPPTPPALVGPPGLLDWLRRCLAKDPDDRFRDAATAARALHALPDEAPAPRARSSALTAAFTYVTADVGAIALAAPLPARSAAPDVDLDPPAPADWRAPAPPRLQPAQGVGLALVPFREPPLLGREVEQDALWQAFVRVATGHGPCTVGLVGPAGAGRTRLGRWVCHRAAETGAGQFLYAPAGGGPAELAQALPAETRPFPGPLAAAVVRVATRPTVLFLDDADVESWLDDVIDALRRAGAPVLVVAATERPWGAADVTLALTPLSVPDIRVVLRSLVSLDPALEIEIAERSAGNPGFTLGMLAALAAGDALEPGPHGLRRRHGIAISADASRQVARRLSVALRGATRTERRALERAAVLGHRFDPAVLARTVRRPPRPALDRLLAGGLLVDEGDAMAFAAPAVRDALLARASTRLAGHHDACARALAAAGAPVHAYAVHLAHGSDPRAALSTLGEVLASEALYRDIPTLRSVLTHTLAALDAAGASPSDRTRVEALSRLAEVARFEGRVREARAVGARALGAARDGGYADLEAKVLGAQARVMRREGSLHDALHRIEQALPLARDCGDDQVLDRLLFDHGIVAIEVGRLDDAERSLLASLALSEASGPARRATVRRLLYWLSRQRGDLDAAERWLDAAGELTPDSADLDVSRANVALRRGDLAGAEAFARSALAGLHAAGSIDEHTARATLGSVLANAGRYEEARAQLLASLASPFVAPMNVGALHMLLVPAVAGLREWDAYDHHLAQATQRIRTMGRVDVDFAHAAELAAHLARGAGERQRAERAAAFGREQRAALTR